MLLPFSVRPNRPLEQLVRLQLADDLRARPHPVARGCATAILAGDVDRSRAGDISKSPRQPQNPTILVTFVPSKVSFYRLRDC
jgi:hypothetical protein